MRPSRAFSLIELLVVMALTVIILMITSSMLSQAMRGFANTRERVDQYRDARIAFETLTRRVAEAKLHTYWDYRYSSAGDPVEYVKQSELHFLSGDASELVAQAASDPTYPGHALFFQSPSNQTQIGSLRGMAALLNVWGYYIEFGDDDPWVPKPVKHHREPRYRFRLLELRQITEDLQIYETENPENLQWLRRSLDSGATHVVAENIVAIVIQPMQDPDYPATLAPDYEYDSRPYTIGEEPPTDSLTLHELPPLVRVTMVAIGEEDAQRLQRDRKSPPDQLDFSSIAPFTSAASYEQDLQALEAHLQRERIAYRVFTERVTIRNSRWGSSDRPPTVE